MFPRVIDRLMELIPLARRETIEGAGHEPHHATPKRYVEITTHQIRQVAN